MVSSSKSNYSSNNMSYKRFKFFFLLPIIILNLIIINVFAEQLTDAKTEQAKNVD